MTNDDVLSLPREPDTRETCLLWICVDCMFMEANGEVEGEPDCEPLGLIGADEQISLGMFWEQHEPDCDAEATGGECECEEISFSWSYCPGCGSTLGGSRHAATLWLPASTAPEEA